MKKWFCLIFIFFLGCKPMQTPVARQQSIRETVGTYEVELVPYSHNQFIIRDTNGAIWYVRSWDDNLFFEKLQLFPAKMDK
jgi:hypothetical protein